MSPRSFLRRLRAYPVGEWLWMGEAMSSLALARLLVGFVPFRLWRRWIGPIGPRPDSGPLTERERAIAIRVRRCVRRVASHVPFQARCLPKVMAARWMLARRGIGTELYFGARTATGEKATDRRINVHAWLLCGPLCLTGADQRMRFSPFAGRTPNAAEATHVSAG